MIPKDDPVAMRAALTLLIQMQKIKNPTNDQKRFIGTLKKMQGMMCNNERQRRIEQYNR